MREITEKVLDTMYEKLPLPQILSSSIIMCLMRVYVKLH